LPQKTVGVFVRAPLPWVLRITEVHLDVGRQREALVIGHLPGLDRPPKHAPGAAQCEHRALGPLPVPATPYNGKEEDLQPFMSLLGSDRFYEKFRDGIQKADVSDMMRRMVNEELLRF